MSELDRDAAREVVAVRTGHIPTEQMLDALEACVRPAPPQGIDRDAVDRVVTDWSNRAPVPDEYAYDEYLDRILALVRPVDGGVVLTREEAEIAVKWYTGDLRDDDSAAEVALIERLEAAS